MLHAGYIIENSNSRILFDPVLTNPFSTNCYSYPEIQFDYQVIKNLTFSAVFISHYHEDHCCFESLNLLDRRTPIFMYCVFEEIFFMLKELGFRNVYPLHIDEAVEVDDIWIIPRKALDADIDSIFHIQIGDLNILNVVDSWIDLKTLKKLAQFAPWDIVLWPFQTMREIDVLTPSRASKPEGLPPEWLEQIKALNPRFIVPSSCQFVQESWSWYNQFLFPIKYADFEYEIKKVLPQTQVLRLNPSVSIILDKDSIQYADPLPWIVPVGDQNLDYGSAENIVIPKTSEIAKRFCALTESETQEVLDYCEDHMLKKYQSMPPPEDPYFGRPRIWKLSLFDHLGNEICFLNEVEQNKIKRVHDPIQPISWSTEVSINKLFAALKNGESLSSMYVRINDRVFHPDIEKEIISADTMMDPLVRCLFNGVFGAYQMAQLERIKGKSYEYRNQIHHSKEQ